MGHVRETKCTRDDCGGTCVVCCLFICKVCNGAEGSLATECPGRRITSEEGDAIYAGTLDFVEGQWKTK